MTTAENKQGNHSPLKAEPLPKGFVSPFKWISQEERNDDLLACLAILTDVSLAAVTEQVVAIGYPKYGPAAMTESQIAQICHAGKLKSTVYTPFKSFSHLPDVCIIFCDWSEEMEVGRHVICHRVHATSDQKGFQYLIDPSLGIPEEQHMTTSLSLIVPDMYVGISRTNDGIAKAPAAVKQA